MEIKKILELLKNNGADLNSKLIDFDGDSLLHRAINRLPSLNRANFKTAQFSFASAGLDRGVDLVGRYHQQCLDGDIKLLIEQYNLIPIRGLATRFDKLKRNYVSVVAIACALLWLPM